MSMLAKFLLFSLVSLCGTARAQESEEAPSGELDPLGKTKITAPQGILELDDMNWWEALHTYDSVMVQFYAPWCWHCQDLEPAYVQAAAILKGDENPVAFAKMDRTLPWHYELCSAWGVPSITPTLRFFRHGVPTIYDGERTTTSLTNWVKKRSGPLWETITTVEELTELKNNHDIFVVVALEDLNSMHLHHCVVQAASEAAGRVKYAITNSSAVIKKLKAKVPSAVLLRNFDQPRTVHFPTEKFNASLCFLDGYSHDISEWVDEYKYPLLLSYTESGIEVHNKLYPKIIPSVMWFFVDDDAADFIAIRKEARAFAAQHKGTVLTMFATESNDASQVMKHFGMKPSDMPCAMLATLNSKKHKQDQFIVPDHNIGAEGLTEFVKNIQGGVGSPAHIRSEDPKPSDMQGIVKKVVAKNFQDMVIHNQDDVVVFLTMRGCPRCNSAFQSYQLVAKGLQSIKSFKFAVFDYNLNDLDHPLVNRLKMDDFPAIIMFPTQNNPQDKNQHAVMFNPSSRRNEQTNQPLAMKMLMWAQEHANMFFEMPNEAIMLCAKPPEKPPATEGAADDSEEL